MKTFYWEKLSDKELLKLRIKDLGLELEHSDVYPAIQKVLGDLRARDLDFHPRVYIGDEWFSPDGYSAVAIPFFLLHPRLRKIEYSMMHECEGEEREEFEKLFRHELGHVFDHAFHVSRRKLWQKHFGSNKKPYTPNNYRPMPYSKNFVHNINDQYAQCHPDEDFAETFAVLVDPKSDWKKRYKGWGALRKLHYVEKLCREFAGVYVSPARGRMLSDAAHLSSSLETYYHRKRKEFEDDFPEFYDTDLLKIFRVGEYLTRYNSASRHLRKHKKLLIHELSQWTGERKIVIASIIDDLVFRARELRLIVCKDEHRTNLEVSLFLSTLLTNYRLTGRFKKVA